MEFVAVSIRLQAWDIVWKPQPARLVGEQDLQLNLLERNLSFKPPSRVLSSHSENRVSIRKFGTQVVLMLFALSVVYGTCIHRKKRGNEAIFKNRLD